MASELLPAWGDATWRLSITTPYGQALKQELEVLAPADRSTPIPTLTTELYSQFHRTGQRLPFERVWQERRRRLARAAVRLLLDPAAFVRPGGVWWGQLLAAIQELLAEPSWAWPAHVRDSSGIGPEVIDLFAAETANLCGELVSLFGPWLPPAWVAAMRQRVLVGMVEPFLVNPEGYGWTAKPSNWNAVCHQGLVGAALALGLETDKLQWLLVLSSQHLQLFLDGFSAGGSCLEGITYWEYGFGWFALLNEQLELWSGGQQSLIEGHEERIRTIARFGPAMLLRDGLLVNFADSRLDMPPRASLLMLLGRSLQLPESTSGGLSLYRQLCARGLDLHAQRCDLFYLTRMLLESPSAEALAKASEPDGADWIDRDAGLVVVRRLDGQGRCWELAVKGGYNDEPHNHNDCGSFLLNVNGQRLAIELGAPEYTADTFGPSRYTLLATRSNGHSVPLVNGQEQAAGREFFAELLEVNADTDAVEIQLDLTHAYPAAAGHRCLLRKIRLDGKAACLTVEDQLWADEPCGLESVLITASDDARVAGLVPLPGSQLASKESLQFRDNRGEELMAWRWRWQSEVLTPSDPGEPQCVAYMIKPAG